MYLIVLLLCISRVTDEAEHLRVCLGVTHTSLGKVTTQVFFSSSLGGLLYFLQTCRNSLRITSRTLFPGIFIVNIFSIPYLPFSFLNDVF